MSVNFVSLSFN